MPARDALDTKGPCCVVMCRCQVLHDLFTQDEKALDEMAKVLRREVRVRDREECNGCESEVPCRARVRRRT